MAIVVEEEKNSSSGLIDLLIWLVILGIIGAITYYIFFKRPNLIEIATPSSFESTQELSKINLNAETILNNPAFRGLKALAPTTTPAATGRVNPFLSF